MSRQLRRSLAAAALGLLLLLLTATPAGATGPFTATGCPSGNFACLRAHHVFAPRVFFLPFFGPRVFFPPQRFTVPHRLICSRSTGQCFIV